MSLPSPSLPRSCLCTPRTQRTSTSPCARRVHADRGHDDPVGRRPSPLIWTSPCHQPLPEHSPQHQDHARQAHSPARALQRRRDGEQADGRATVADIAWTLWSPIPCAETSVTTARRRRTAQRSRPSLSPSRTPPPSTPGRSLIARTLGYKRRPSPPHFCTPPASPSLSPSPSHLPPSLQHHEAEKLAGDAIAAPPSFVFFVITKRRYKATILKPLKIRIQRARPHLHPSSEVREISPAISQNRDLGDDPDPLDLDPTVCASRALATCMPHAARPWAAAGPAQ